ncbi:MAG: hypothetical protein AB7S38_24655 [Vulcanimicrobiota bacterium]
MSGTRVIVLVIGAALVAASILSYTMGRPQEELSRQELESYTGTTLPVRIFDLHALRYKGLVFARFELEPSELAEWQKSLSGWEEGLRPRGMELKLERDWWKPGELTEVTGRQVSGVSLMAAAASGNRVVCYMFGDGGEMLPSNP